MAALVRSVLVLALLAACPSADDDDTPTDDDDAVDDDDSGDDDDTPPVDCSADAWATGWERIGDAPVLRAEGWEGSILRPTATVRVGDVQRLYYVTAALEPCGDGDCPVRRIGLAETADNTTFTRVGDGPVLDGWPRGVSVAHSALQVDDDGYTLWYGRSAQDEGPSIAAATSADGLVWDLGGGAPALEPDGEGWDAEFVGAPAVLAGDSERLWYTGAAGDTASLGLAVRDGDGWRRDGDAAVFRPGPGGTYDDRAIADPFLIEVEGCLVLGYKASSSEDPPDDENLGLAVSSDGVAWTRASAPILARERTYESDGLVDPVFWRDGEDVYMAYAALEPNFVNSIALAKRTIPRTR